MDGLEPGQYDSLVDEEIAAALAALPAGLIVGQEDIDTAELPERLATHLASVLRSSLPDVDEGQRLETANAIIRSLGRSEGVVIDPPARLLSVAREGLASAPPPPDIPLGQHDLLVNARGEPHLAAELKKELSSADHVDLIVAFVRWYGVRLIVDELAEAVQRGARVRLLTTTYTGSTERKALDKLTALGVDVRVSYDTQTTRLHAKSWIFHRNTGFSTAYVGSSNLTHTALMDGREWNVRLSNAASPALFEKVGTAFEAQWASGDYETYDPDRFDAELARSTSPAAHLADSVLSGLEMRAWPYQDEILDALTVEREVHGSTRNLVVAPTGTGKTVVAALDYRRLVREHGDLSLLFVAHREQILVQSRRTFREALGEGSFGEMLVGGQRPEGGRHVFASIQTLASMGTDGIAPDEFDVVIVDEFHHAEASTYTKLLDHLEPRWLLALTATPERADGLDIRRWTDDRTAFDMRLWHALDRQLLAPFQYFGVADTVDLADVRWSSGGYSADDLTRVYTANDIRANLVTKQVDRIIGEPRQMRALAFCATVDHARQMTDVFNRRGWPAAMIDASTPQSERESLIKRLESAGDPLTTIFTRDVFNEGVDIPTVDTILLLRPTESVTVYLQQIGRGLRRHETKPVCTILDFVAQYRREYRFDLRLRALTGIPRRELTQAAEEGFPYLPSGCHIELDRQSKEWVIQHLKEAVKANRPALRKELQLLASQGERRVAPTLAEFIEHSGVELEDVEKIGWTALKRDVDLERRPVSGDEGTLQRGVGRLLHLDDTDRIDTLSGWLAQPTPPTLTTERDKRLAWGFLVTLWSLRGAPDSLDAAWAGLWESAPIREELLEVLPLLRERIARPSMGLPDGDVPLRLHGTYARDEILAGFGRLTPGERYSHQAGPWWHEPAMTEVLFITLRKSEKQYSPSTLYKDYALSRELFHWESQNMTRVASTSGQRYVNQRSNGVRILLAVRATKLDPWGNTNAYTLLGPAQYVSHKGERPIAITWKLDNPIPADLYEEFKVAAA